MDIGHRFWVALAFTEIFEIPVLFLLARVVFKISAKKISNGQLLFVGFLTSFATLPYLWFVLPWVVNTRKFVLLIEFGIVLAEGIMLWRLLGINIKRSLIMSLAANASSYLFGKILFAKLLLFLIQIQR